MAVVLVDDAVSVNIIPIAGHDGLFVLSNNSSSFLSKDAEEAPMNSLQKSHIENRRRDGCGRRQSMVVCAKGYDPEGHGLSSCSLLSRDRGRSRVE